MNKFESFCDELIALVNDWETKLLELDQSIINERRNTQNRNIKQIVGHMIDSASNNNHRIVHLQYQESPFAFPNYASYGNNDRWIAIQNYEKEEWNNLVQLWKYANLHIAHIVQNVDQSKLKNEWIADKHKNISLEEMIIDYLRHFKLHLGEIEELLKN